MMTTLVSRYTTAFFYSRYTTAFFQDRVAVGQLGPAGCSEASAVLVLKTKQIDAAAADVY